MRDEILHALNRFGLGRLSDEALPGDARSWLAEQLDTPDPRAAMPMPSTHYACQVCADEDRFNRGGSHTLPDIGTTFRGNLADAVRHAVVTDLPVRERLVLFWANHFSISAKPGGYGLAMMGPFLHEAIRPHITGRFEDLLRAALLHTGMILYYGAQDSVGPDSVVGRRGRGLNENLARETLELFTLGLEAGYTQSDVTAVAHILTGWGFELNQEPLGTRFRPEAHQPGPKHAFGQSFPEGEVGTQALIRFLGTHPATYRHIATRLVRHYIADEPAAADVAMVHKTLVETGGDLRAAMDAVIARPGAWVPMTKLRTPVEHSIALHRALGLMESSGKTVFWSAWTLGQGFWEAPLPIGWPDTAADWTGGEAMLRRADLAWKLAGVSGTPRAAALADRTLGGMLSATTAGRMAAAPSRGVALALLLASPEFMRR